MADDVLGEYDSAAKLALVTSAVGVAIATVFMLYASISGWFADPSGWIFAVEIGAIALVISAIIPAFKRNAYLTRQFRLQEKIESDDSE